MADREMILLLIALIVQVAQVESAAIYRGCFKENLRNRHFKLSPGYYDPPTLTVEKCTELCGMYKESYAGVISGRFCFCGPTEPDAAFSAAESDCATPCGGNSSQMCGGDMHLNVYQSAVPIGRVDLSASPVFVKTGDPVSFTIDVDSVSPMTFAFDYDDGNGAMPSNLTGMLSKTYVIPGKVEPMVTARDVGGAVLPKSDNAGVVVQAAVSGVTVECPLFVTDEENFCVTTITTGTRLLLWDEVVGTRRNIKVADPVVDGAGCCVPSTTDPQPKLSPVPDGVYMMFTSEFRFDGVIIGWEFWADIGTGTQLTVMVLKPCADYCYHTNTCGVCVGTTCAADSFCLRSLTCSPTCSPVVDRYATRTVNYDIRETVTLTAAAGYQYIEAPDPVQVYAGDILAYTKTSTSAVITVSSGQAYSDYHFAPGTTTFASGSGNEQTGYRHHLRAIYSSQTKVRQSYTFSTPGTYPLVTNVTNMDIPHFEVNNTEIEVLQGINATIIDTVTYWVSGEQGTINILPYTGTNVKINWIFGDGTVENDTVVDNKNYTYSGPGTYMVEVTLHNQLSSKTNATTIIVETRITGFNLDPINCVTLTNCPFTIRLTTGSDYVITWDFGDTTTETTAEAVSGNGAVVNHIFNVGGTYTVTANCSNNVSSEVKSLVVMVQEECQGLALVRQGAEKNVDFRIEWTLTQGSDCVFVLTFNNDIIPFTKVADKKWQTSLLPGRVANIYPLTLNVSNAIGNDEINVNFTIETAMKNVETSCDQDQVGTGIPVKCSVTMDEGSNVVCTWDFDDGTVVSHNEGPSDWALRVATPEMRSHTFSVGKLNNVTITCANNDRAVTQYHPILVVVSVMDVTLVHQDTIFFSPPGIGEFYFTTSGAIPNAAKVEFDFGDTFDLTDDLVLNTAYVHEYRDPSAPGNCYAIEARLWNAVSNKTFSGTQMCVIDPIQNLKVMTDPPGAIKNEPVNAKISMYRGPSGSFARISCDFGDGNAAVEWDRVGSDQDGEDTRQVTYSTLGPKTITCTVTTPLENATANYVVEVDEPVTSDCTISTNFPVEHTVNDIEYSIVCNTAPMPTNAVITIDPGDGSPVQTVQFSGPPGMAPIPTPGVPQIITYTPPTDGHFVASISLKNGGSNISDTLLAGSYIRLTTTTNLIQYQPDIPVGGPLLNGIDNSYTDFPTDSAITSTVSVGAGTPVNYVLTATHSSGTPVVVCNKTSTPFSCKLPNPGNYTVRSEVFNPLGSSTPEIKTITMREPVSNFFITDLTPNANPGADKTFEFNFDTLGEASCLGIDFDDGTQRIFKYGDAAYCETAFPGPFYSGTLSNPKRVTFRYGAPGNYQINATILNTFSQTHTTFTHSVSTQDCSKPSTAIEDSQTDFRTPLKFEKGKRFVLRGKSNITCPVTLKNKKTWSVQSINPSLGTVTSTNALTSDKAELVVDAWTLDYGLFKATYKIQMSVGDGTTFEGSSFTYFEVTKSKLNVIVERGGISEVTRGENEVVTFDPSTISRDPDVEPSADQGFTGFTWKCEIQVNNGSAPTACDSITGSTAIPLTFSTSLFLIGEKILLSVTGTKDDRASTGTIVVNIVSGNPVSLYIQPTGSSLTIQMSDGILVASEDRLGLEVKCKDCGTAELVCKWTAYSFEYRWPWRMYYDSEVKPHLAGMESPIIAIMSSLYSIHPTVLLYRFSVKCSTVGRETGEAAINVHLNRPPQGGNCTVTPKEGTLSWSGNGPFNVKCTGWTDSDGIAIYRFYSKLKNNQLEQQIQIFREADDVYLNPPAGADYDDDALELFVSVEDQKGSSVDVLIDRIVVRRPSIDQIKEWTTEENRLTSSYIDKLEASGEQREVTELLTKSSSLLNAVRKQSEIGYQGMEGIGPSLQSTTFLAVGDNTVQEGQDPVLAAANKKNSDELLQQYEIERDSNAALRDQIALVCSQMTCPNTRAMAQVLTCLNTVASAPDECRRICQQSTLDKAMEIGLSLENLQASAEEKISVAVTVLNVVMQSVTAGEVNKNYPVLKDLSNARESQKYMDYDTSLFSKEPSLKNADDAFKQHAKNVHLEEQNELAERNSVGVKRTIDAVTRTLAKTLTPGETLNFSTSAVVGSVKHVDVAAFQGQSIELLLTSSRVQFPEVDIFGGVLSNNETAVISTTATMRDSHNYAEGQDSLGESTQYVTIEILKSDGSPAVVKNTPEPIKIVIPNSSTPKYVTAELFIAPWNTFFYQTLTVEGEDPSVHVHMKELDDPNIQVLLVVYKGTSVDIEEGKCDDLAFLPHTLTPPRKTMYTMSDIKVNKYNGIVTLGFRVMPKGFDTSNVTSCDDLDKVDLTQPSAVVNISVATFVSGCYFFDEDENKWSSEDSWVGEETTVEETVCYTTHLTTFGGGWAVAPNTIDWNFVFSNADFYKNPTIYITEIIIALIYILAVVWARRKDKKDVERLGLTPLKDNDPRDKYYYEIVVATGMRRNAGTDSKVFLILSGEYDETDARLLNDDKRKVFRRGNTDAFLMAVPEPLGALNYARVWHDNSGKGKFGSWYMKYLIVRDVQTEQKWIFICNRWFAVEEDDGQVDRVVPVAGLAQMTEFGHLFSERSKKNLVDGHLWFSVVARPPQSRFTRVQRVSCCLCLLYATMLGNAMFYGLVDSQSGTAFTFGPFALSPQQIYVGIICNLIVFPANFIIITLFRKSKARKMRPSRLEEALKKMPVATSASMTDIKPEVRGIWSTRPDSRGQSRAESSFSQDRPGSSLEDRVEKRKKKKKKFELPWFCRILGWILLWAVTLTSAAFVTFYGIMFQDEKCKKWITSMLISFFTSIFVTQPVKVFLTAIFFSLVWRNPTDDDDDQPEDEEEAKLASDEEYMHGLESGYGAARPRKIGYKPPDPAALEKARIKRLNEIKMWDIIREIVFYSFFLWILMVISYRNRSPYGFFYKDTLEKMCIKNNDTLQWFTKIQNTENFWKWARSGMVTSLRASQYYNNDPPLLLRGFVGDKVSRIMGYATMRQLRVKPALCQPIDVMAKVIPECNEPYSLFSESKGSYGPGWSPLGVNETARMEYYYRSASDLNGFPYWGLLEVYGGGGYVVELIGSTQTLTTKMLELESENWIDKYTRAVFVEFTVYNPQVNLFAIATILAEFQPSGGVLTSYRFEPAMLLPYMTSVMIFQIVCEIIYFIFTIVFIVKEFRTFLKERTNYFKSFWNLVEISIIAMSIGSIVVYFYRLIITNTLTNEFKRTHGNEYMKFQYAGYWNELFTYMIGWLVFFGTLKFLKLLRFNKRMSLLASTLKNGAHSILHFSILFWILYLAFMQLFYLTFKNVSAAFTTFIMAAESGLLMMMGKFDIYGMLMVEPILTQVYVFFFVVTVTFVLVNMFLSILNETFGSVRVDISKQNNDYEIVDFMVNRFKTWTGIGTVRENTNPTPNANGEPRDREPTVEQFPDRIDRLLNSISNVYMDDNIGSLLESNGESKKMAMKHMLRGPNSGAPRIGPTRVHTH